MVGHVKCIGDMINAYIFFGKLKERDHLGGISIDGRMKLRCILKKREITVWIEFV
jgi:hypothetical protein